MQSKLAGLQYLFPAMLRTEPVAVLTYGVKLAPFVEFRLMMSKKACRVKKGEEFEGSEGGLLETRSQV